jgi:KDO2-lipid IV(A) lauroyltransferase
MSAQYVGWRLSQWLSHRLPTPLLYRCAEPLADCQWRWCAKDRQAVQANLTLALGAPVPERSPVVREVFRNFARYLVEFFSIHRVPAPSVELEGYGHLEDARRRRHGVIVLAAHFGNWEVGAVLIRRMGFPLSAVALPHADPRTDRLFNDQRRRCGIDVIPLGQDAMALSLRRLRDGHLLGVLGDQQFTRHGVSVTLCGRTVTLPSGPVLLSLRSRAAMVPTFLVREGAWKFRLCFEPPIWPEPRQGGPSAFQRLMQRYASILERYLTRFPSQWLLFQPLAGSV